MQNRHWVIQSGNHLYQLSYSSKYWSYIILDGRRVELPQSRYMIRDIDFRLPIDELDVWCRYARHKYFDVYVNDVILPDLEGSTPPRLSIESYRTISGILAIGSFILCLLVLLLGLALGWL